METTTHSAKNRSKSRKSDARGFLGPDTSTILYVAEHPLDLANKKVSFPVPLAVGTHKIYSAPTNVRRHLDCSRPLFSSKAYIPNTSRLAKNAPFRNQLFMILRYGLE